MLVLILLKYKNQIIVGIAREAVALLSETPYVLTL